MTVRRISALPLLALFAIGCSEDVPAEPTWFGEVQGIMRANCVRCHGFPASDIVPELDEFGDNRGFREFRLDRYVKGKNAGSFDDVADKLDAIIFRTLDFKLLGVNQMPLDGNLTADQRETLRRWAEAGFPRGARDNNQLPTSTLIKPAVTPMSIDQVLDLRFRVADADGDGLIVAVGYRQKGTDVAPTILAFPPTNSFNDSILVRNMQAGASPLELSIDSGQIRNGVPVEIVAIIDDGHSDDPAENQHISILVPEVQVSHPNGAAPTVEVLNTADGDKNVIKWKASDPESNSTDKLKIDVYLVRLDPAGGPATSTRLASDLENDNNDNGKVVWATLGSTEVKHAGGEFDGDFILYQFRVTATDSQGNSRSALSEPFSIATTTHTWEADIKPIFTQYCADICHGEPSENGAPGNYRWDKYDMADQEMPINDDLGVFDKRDIIFRELIEFSRMPPVGNAVPSDAEKAIIREWLAAGAPLNGSM